MGKKNVSVIAVVVVLCILIQVFGLAAIRRSLVDAQHADARVYGESVASSIELMLAHYLNVTEELSIVYLEYGDDFIEHFDSLCERVAHGDEIIGSMYFAPGGVIDLAYPQEVYESTHGFNMLEDPEQGQAARLARDSGNITVSGPHALVEGGVGFIIRNPVVDASGSFVGFTIVILDWDGFIQRVLADMPHNAMFEFGVWKDDPAHILVDDDGFMFTSGARISSREVDIPIEVPNDVWHLSVEPRDGWAGLTSIRPYAILSGVAIAGIVGAVAFALYGNDRNRKLDVEVAANAAKSTFLSNMSHDIRTPINGIMGMTAIAQSNIDDKERVKDCLQKIDGSSRHLLSLVNDVLDMSRIESGKTEITCEPLDVRTVVEDCRLVVASQAADKGIDFDVELCDVEHPHVLADALHLRQVLLNILGNAVKFTPEGGSVRFRVSEKEAHAGRATMRFEVCDTGIGMTDEFIGHIWTAFAQAKESGDARRVGSGLGMAIAKNLVDLMGGTIDVASELGRGSTFTVELPFTIVEEDDSRRQDAPEKPGQLELRGTRILLVEDHPVNMEIAKTLLESRGIEIVTAENGKIALDLFEQSEPGAFDAIVTDLQMPVMDGIEEAKAIRALDRSDALEIPIVAMTANAFVEDVERTRQAGMNAHVAKPFEIDELMQVLTALVHR